MVVMNEVLQPLEQFTDFGNRQPTSRASVPPGVCVSGPSDLTPRDHAYAVCTVNRLRRLPGLPHEAVTVRLAWLDGEDRPAAAVLRMTGNRQCLEMQSCGRNYVEALDRLEVSIRLAGQ